MSNYYGTAVNPATGKLEDCEFMDDYFGRHRYGVRFDANPIVYPEDQVTVIAQQQIKNTMEQDFQNMVMALAKPGYQIKESLTTSQCHLLHMTMGVSGEAGELLDAVKKHVIYGKELDLENVTEEAGDILFYLEGLLHPLGITLDTCRQATMAKLAKRYPGLAYTNQAAIERADKC